MRLVICEKFSVAQELALLFNCTKKGRFEFSDGFLQIGWLDGHMCSLAPPEFYDKKFADRSVFPVIPKLLQFIPRSREAITQLEHLKSLALSADDVVNACDPGREGELIFRLVWDYFGSPKKPVFRLWLHDNTPDGIRKAWSSLEAWEDPKFEALSLAAKTRAKSDWLLGINGSRAITKLLGNRVWSIGRVQTAVLNILHDREQHIKTFKSQPYYSLYAKFDGVDTYEARMLVPEGFKKLGKFGHIFESDQEVELADTLFKRTTREEWETKDETKRNLIHAPPLFNLLGLQRFCANQLGWGAARTLAAAQSAYSEYKTISYPRTDSTFLPEGFMTTLDDLYKKVWGHVRDELERLDLLDMPLPSTNVRQRKICTFSDAKVTDHYAIIPTGVPPTEYESDAFLVWRIVARRFIMHFFTAAEYDSFSRMTTLNYTLTHAFAAYNAGDVIHLCGVTTVDSLVKQGWLDAAQTLSMPIPDTIPRERRLPNPEYRVRFDKTELYQGFTEPPDYFSEDTLLGRMDNLSLGTAATQAGIIDTLIQRGYIKRQDARPPKFRVQADGDTLITSLGKNALLGFFDPDVTSEWEEKLSLIEQQALSAVDADSFLKEIVEQVQQICDVVANTDVTYCPISKKLVEELTDSYVFPGVPKPLPKIFVGRAMSIQDYRLILSSKKAVGPFKGFISKKSGSEFQASLKYNSTAKKLEFEFK